MVVGGVRQRLNKMFLLIRLSSISHRSYPHLPSMSSSIPSTLTSFHSFRAIFHRPYLISFHSFKPNHPRNFLAFVSLIPNHKQWHHKMLRIWYYLAMALGEKSLPLVYHELKPSAVQSSNLHKLANMFWKYFKLPQS